MASGFSRREVIGKRVLVVLIMLVGIWLAWGDYPAKGPRALLAIPGAAFVAWAFIFRINQNASIRDLKDQNGDGAA